MRSLRVLPLLLSRLTVPDGPGQLGILGSVIGCIAVGFMDYATDHRTTIKMRCRIWDVFPHAPDMPLSMPWRMPVKLILRYWAVGNRAGMSFYLTLKSWLVTPKSSKDQKIRRSEGVKEFCGHACVEMEKWKRKRDSERAIHPDPRSHREWIGREHFHVSFT